MSRSNLGYAHFLALLPNEEVKRRIREEMGKLDLNIPLRPDDVFHVTLNDFDAGREMPFALPVHVMDAIDLSCHALAATTAPFNVVLDQLLSYKYNKALALAAENAPNSELKTFRRSLREELKRNGVVTDSRFSPHLTLLYGDHQVNELISPPITWLIEEFVLVRSHLGRTHHEYVRRWKLTGSPGSQLTQSEFSFGVSLVEMALR